ncbi:MAG: hypothetical protein AAGB35_10035 [Pseudomonadota bacterium]
MNKEAKVNASQLFHFLARGEEIAAQCAQYQSRLAHDKKSIKFFKTQARQETQHAFIFNQAKRHFKQKNMTYICQRSLDKFEQKLSSTLNEDKLQESIIAQQLLFEGLGEITLNKVSQGIEDRGFSFNLIRKTILKQERAHHHFGERYIENLLADPDLKIQPIINECKDFMEILNEALYDMSSVLEFYNQSTNEFYQLLMNDLPFKIRNHL